MTWTYIGHVDHFLEENKLPPERRLPGAREASSFLERLTRKMAQACTTFYEVVGILPLDGERQIQSIVLPAMYQISKAVYVEHPITRETERKEKASGRIDYWVYYEQFVFLIELKVIWIKDWEKPLHLSDNYQRCWKSVLNQLLYVPKNEATWLAIEEGKVLKIAMLMVPTYRWSATEIEPISRADIAEVHHTLSTTLKPEPNWCCTLAFPGVLQQLELDNEEGHELYPSLSVMTHIQTV